MERHIVQQTAVQIVMQLRPVAEAVVLGTT